MSFFNYLERVRREPEAKRQRLALWWSLLLTLLVVGLWFANLRLADWVKSEETPGGPGLTVGFREALSRIKTGWRTLVE